MLGILLGLVPSAAGLPAQELVIVAKPLHARALAGQVVDPSGETISGATVEERDATGTKTLSTTKTDDRGHFALKPIVKGTRHHLRIFMNGFKPFNYTVILSARAEGELQLKLAVAE